MVVQPDLVVYTSSSSAQEAEADRVKVSLVYTASSRTPKATREKNCLKPNNNNKKNKDVYIGRLWSTADSCQSTSYYSK